jgi:hypothetical protein
MVCLTIAITFRDIQSLFSSIFIVLTSNCEKENMSKMVIILDSGLSKSHDKGDAKWIVIKRQLRGNNNMPFGQPTPGQSIGHPGVACPQEVFSGFSY